MRELIIKLHKILNSIKDFEAGYSSKTAHEGKMLIIYRGTKYAVLIKEIQNPSEDVFDDIRNLEWII